jgi:hypothetical protein
MKQTLIPLIFFSQFKRPLTLKQLRRYIWGEELSETDLKRILKRTDVKQSGDFYCLDEYHVLEVKPRQKLAERFWKKTKKHAWLFANVPFIKMIVVSNTLSYDNVTENSDIDLFVVARNGRVWTTRAFLLAWMTLFGVRVRSEKKFLKFSPEMFVDESAMDLSQCALANDYHLAYWVVDFVPVWKADFFEEFWKSNYWLKQKLPVAYRSPNIKREFMKRDSSSWFAWGLEKILGGSFGDRIERWAKQRQIKIIEKSRERLGINPSVILDDNVIKVHFNDKRAESREFIEEWLAGHC